MPAKHPLPKDAPKITAKSYGERLASYTRARIQETEDISALQAEALRFKVAGLTLPVRINPKVILDVGATRPNECITVASMAPDENQDLWKYLGQELGHELSADDHATLVVYRGFDATQSLATGAIAIGQKLSVLLRTGVAGASRTKCKGAGLHLVAGTGLRTLHYLHQSPPSKQVAAARARLQRRFPPREWLHVSRFGKVLTWDRGEWWQVPLLECARITTPVDVNGETLNPVRPDRWILCDAAPKPEWSRVQGQEAVPPLGLSAIDLSQDFEIGGDVLLAEFMRLQLNDPSSRSNGNNLERDIRKQALSQQTFDSAKASTTEDYWKSKCYSDFYADLGAIAVAAVTCHSASGICLPCHGFCVLAEAVAVALAYKRLDACLGA